MGALDEPAHQATCVMPMALNKQIHPQTGARA